MLFGGLVDYMEQGELKELKATVPAITNSELNERMHHADTVWYDEESMVFSYQDSVETVVGVRANRVGRETGELNRNIPGIAKLMDLFGEDKKFRFPFRGAAGTDDVKNVKVVNFWSPPKLNGEYLPVKWWRASSRGRWHWTFPINTLFGEILFIKNPKGGWLPFEIRTRKRYGNGWEVDLFRPYATANQLAEKIIDLKPEWKSNTNTKRFIEHLRSPSTLQPFKLEATVYKKAFETVDGALDYLPEIGDDAFVTELLKQPTFVSTQGKIWKENSQYETYAPSSAAEYSIVPKDYKMGVIPVNEVSCNRCHDQTGRGLGDFDPVVVLYGEIWGEDRAFTWHLFKPHSGIYGTFDDSDRSPSRQLNPKLLEAGLLKNEKPNANDPLYRSFEPWKLFDQ